jgi:transposase, IS5 family
LVSIATTNREGLVLGMMSLPGNPDDGHTLTAALAQVERISATEPVIGHMKSDGRLDRNFLAGTRGDAINALLSGAGYDIRLILNHFKGFLRALLRLLISHTASRYQPKPTKSDSSGTTG